MQNPRCLKTTVAGDSGKLGRCQGGLPILSLRWKLETRRGISFQDIYCAVWWARVPVPLPTLFQKPTALKQCCAFRLDRVQNPIRMIWGILGLCWGRPHTTPNSNSQCFADGKHKAKRSELPGKQDGHCARGYGR